jgi:hypothetical protein
MEYRLKGVKAMDKKRPAQLMELLHEEMKK